MHLRYNKRSKKQEEDVLKQGLTLPSPVASSSESLPPARDLPPSLEIGNEQEKHRYHLPANTAGQASVRKVPTILPKLLQLPSSSVMSVNFSGPLAASPVAPVVIVPASTHSYRKRKEEEARTSVVPPKKYKARVGASKCSKCNMDRTTATGHKQYFGNWFCPTTATQTYEEWREHLQKEKQYKKKK